ncbi:unnamed protein product [Symbiodinium sp. CCMP2592]|nr:unnamed protein product [Symbiodinium sp. CCMP2592]
MAQSCADIENTVYAAINEVKWLEVEAKLGRGCKEFSFNLTFHESPEQAALCFCRENVLRGLKVNLSDAGTGINEPPALQSQSVAVSRADSVAGSSDTDPPPAKKIKKSTAVEVKVTPQRNFIILEHKVNLMKALESGKATMVKDKKFYLTGLQIDIDNVDFKVHKCSLAAKVNAQDLSSGGDGTEATLPKFAFFSVANGASGSRVHRALMSASPGTFGQFGDRFQIFFGSVEIAGMMAWLCQPSYTANPVNTMQISKHVFNHFPGFTHVHVWLLLLHDLQLNFLESGLLDLRQSRGRGGFPGHCPGRDGFLGYIADLHDPVSEGEVHSGFLQEGDCKHKGLPGLCKGRRGAAADETGHPARQDGLGSDPGSHRGRGRTDRCEDQLS